MHTRGAIRFLRVALPLTRPLVVVGSIILLCARSSPRSCSQESLTSVLECEMSRETLRPAAFPPACLGRPRHSCATSQASSVPQSVSAAQGVGIHPPCPCFMLLTAEPHPFLISFTHRDRRNCNQLHPRLPFVSSAQTYLWFCLHCIPAYVFPLSENPNFLVDL